MPTLDVTDILSDPDFATTFDVIRTSEVIDANGRADHIPVVTNAVVGVVLPSGGNLIRQPDGSRHTGAIEIYTTFMLSDGSGSVDFAPADGATVAADIVVWNGGQYTVVNSQDYSQFGAGYIQATGQLLGVNK